MSFSWRGAPVRALAAALVIFTSACTTVTVTPEAAAPPKQTYHTIVVGLLKPKSPDLGYLNSYFRDGLVRRLKELKAFDTIVEAQDTAKMPAVADAPDTLTVLGTLTEADKGNAALRLLIGFGGGREHVTAELEMEDGKGKSLGRLQIRKAYSGGAGIGGAGFIDIQDLTTQVGEQAAQTVLDWSQGKDIATN